MKRYIKDIEKDITKYTKLVIHTVDYYSLLANYKYLSKLLEEFNSRSKRRLPVSTQNAHAAMQKRLLNIMFGCGIKTTYEEFFDTFKHDKVLKPEVFIGIITNLSTLVRDKKLPCTLQCKIKVVEEDNIFYFVLKDSVRPIKHIERTLYADLNVLVLLERYKNEHLSTGTKCTVIEQCIHHYTTLVNAGYDKSCTLVGVAQEKYFVYLDAITNNYSIDYVCGNKLPGLQYFSESTAEKVCQILNAGQVSLK